MPSRSDLLGFHELALEWSWRIILCVKSSRWQGRHAKMTYVAGSTQVQAKALVLVPDVDGHQHPLHS